MNKKGNHEFKQCEIVVRLKDDSLNHIITDLFNLIWEVLSDGTYGNSSSGIWGWSSLLELYF